MLMSDTWQPAVLHLLPFSTNDASNPRPPSSARLRALPTPDHSRGFPVLAVTRRGKDSGEGGGGGGLSGGFPPGNRLTPQRRSSPVRASSERLPRSQSQADSPLSTSRAKSDYNDRRGNRSGNSTSRQGNALTRDNATCSITDLNERIMSRMMMRADSSSPDSAVGSHGNSPFSSATPEAFGTSGPQGLPKPAFLSNGPSPNGVSSSVNSEGRYLVSGKNGLWRSVTMTPGELELKKHREHLDRAQTMRNGAGEPKAGKRYKLNVKDLPRSSTPVNDHDPDKLNMKQVIAFLQSKGKSQADAVELPKDLSTKFNKSGFRRAAKSGVMRSRVHRILTSSSTAEIAARVMTGKNGVEPGAVESSPKTSPTTVRVRDVSDNARSSTSLPPARGQSAKDWQGQHSNRASARERNSESTETGSEKSPRKTQRPFRLHRFVTIAPSHAELPTVTNRSQDLTTSQSNTANVESHVTKSALHERTLCLDLAAQSKSQSSSNMGPRSATKDHFTSENRVQYRIPVHTHRPSSLRVEHDESESEWKLSKDLGDHDGAVFVTDETRELKNVIRLPYVQVDSEDEDASVADSKRHINTKALLPKPEKQSKSKPEPKKVTEKAANANHTKPKADALSEKGSLSVNPPSEATVSSSTIHTSTKSSGSLASQDDAKSDAVTMSDVREESVDSTSVELGSDKQQAAKRLRVSLPRHTDDVQDPGQDQSQGQNQGQNQGQSQGHRHQAKPKAPECVTLSLRKERNRTREKTYMSEIGGSDVVSDDTCAARVNSDSVRLSIRSDEAVSWVL